MVHSGWFGYVVEGRSVFLLSTLNGFGCLPSIYLELGLVFLLSTLNWVHLLCGLFVVFVVFPGVCWGFLARTCTRVHSLPPFYIRIRIRINK